MKIEELLPVEREAINVGLFILSALVHDRCQLKFIQETLQDVKYMAALTSQIAKYNSLVSSTLPPEEKNCKILHDLFDKLDSVNPPNIPLPNTNSKVS